MFIFKPDVLVIIQAVFLMQMAWNKVLCQLHYSIPEESKHGTFVGRIAQDLGMEIIEINSRMLRIISKDQKEYFQPKQPHPDWRYSASLRAAMQGAVHMEGAAVLHRGVGGLEQQWPTVSSATTEPEGGEVSPPVGAGVNCNSWTFKYGPGNPKQPVPQIPPDFPENFIIPGSPAIISIRQDQPSAPGHKSNFITFGKKEETKKKKKKKRGNKNQDKGNNAADNNDQ